MDTITLRVHRLWAPSFDDAPAKRKLHQERAALLHKMANDLDLEIVDWGETDGQTPREIVEVVIGVATQLIAEAIATRVRVWWSKRKVKDIEFRDSPAGVYIPLSYLNEQERKALGEYIWKGRSTSQEE